MTMCFFWVLGRGARGPGQIGQIGQNILTLSPPTDGFFKKAAGSAPARLTLHEMMQRGFYELFDCRSDAATRTITRHFKELAKIYHPDKGGSAVTFRYLQMAAEVLKKPNLRAEYDANGKNRWTKAFAASEGHEAGAEEQPDGPRLVPAPCLNVDFLKHLLEQRGTYECKIGNLTLDCYLQAALARLAQPEDCYYESSIATRLGLRLRLVGTKGVHASVSHASAGSPRGLHGHGPPRT